MLVQIDADGFLSFPDTFGVNRETAGVATQIENLFPPKTRQPLAVIALIEEKAGLVLTAGRNAEMQAVFGDDAGGRRLRERQSKDSCLPI